MPREFIVQNEPFIRTNETTADGEPIYDSYRPGDPNQAGTLVEGTKVELTWGSNEQTGDHGGFVALDVTPPNVNYSLDIPLSRKTINAFIRQLRRARDKVFEADE